MSSAPTSYYSHRPGDLSRRARISVDGLSIDGMRRVATQLRIKRFEWIDFCGSDVENAPHLESLVAVAAQFRLKSRIVFSELPTALVQERLHALYTHGLTEVRVPVTTYDDSTRACLKLLDSTGAWYSTYGNLACLTSEELARLAGALHQHLIYAHEWTLWHDLPQPDRLPTLVRTRISEIAPSIRAAVEELERHFISVTIRGVPLCHAEGFEKNVVGMRSMFYDPHYAIDAEDQELLAQYFDAPRTDSVEGPASALLGFRPAKTSLLGRLPILGFRDRSRVFPEKCEPCAAFDLCDGVLPEYLLTHNQQELEPLSKFEVAPLHSTRRSYFPAFRLKQDAFEPMGEAMVQAFGCKKTKQPVAPRTVTVVIPNHNYADLLGTTLDSILNQTYSDFELIVVDNASTDNSREVIQSYIEAHPQHQIKLIAQEDLGCSAGRNNGILAGEGRYILPVDADDIIAPDMLESCVDVLDRNADISIVYTDRVSFGMEHISCQSPEYNLNYCKYQNQLNYCAMFRREVFDTIGGYRVDPVNLGDWGFWIAAGAAGFRFAHLMRPLFRYRVHKRSETFRDLKFNQQKRENQIVLNNPGAYHATEIQAAAMLLEQDVHIEVPEGPSITVVAHTRSVAALQDLLPSLRDQTYRPAALTIVSEDPDVSEFVEQNLPQISSRVINLSKPNSLFDHYNQIVKTASTELLSFIEDGVTWSSKHLATVASNLNQQSNFGAAYSFGWDITSNPPRLFGRGYCPETLLAWNYLPSTGCVFKLAEIQSVGGFDPSTGPLAMWDLFIRLSQQKPFYCVPTISHHFKPVISRFQDADLPRVASAYDKVCLKHRKICSEAVRKSQENLRAAWASRCDQLRRTASENFDTP